MNGVKEFKLNNRYRVHRQNPAFVCGVKIPADAIQRWTISDRIERLAKENFGVSWYLPQRGGNGWNQHSRWAHSFHSKGKGTFFFFKSQEDWETIKLMYVLKFT